jgi:MFS family permease
MILSRDLNAQRIIRTYLTITGLFNGALALIWGVNTLFLLQAGLDIFHVMLVNAAFSFAEFVFEVPTGVVADTLGRRVSLLFCLITLLAAWPRGPAALGSASGRSCRVDRARSSR